MINIEKYGWKASILPEEAEGLPARVTAVHRERYELICRHGIISGKLKTVVYYKQSEEFPTVGDFVLLQYESAGDSLIIKTLPRKSFFSRRDPSPGRGEQAVAANFDTVFVMTSLNKDFNIGRLERYLTLAWQSNAVPVIILTKADLTEDYETQISRVEEIAIGVNVVAVSSVTGHGLDELEVYLQPGKTVVFLGSSGVGKSSLLNALADKKLMDVKAVREDDGRGRHTTTHRQLFVLPSGAMVIDTPGMRELGILESASSMPSRSSGIGKAFTDVDEILSRNCRFSDCKHETEPGCSVKMAIETGELPLERWQRYLNLKYEARFNDDKIGFLREKQQWHKSLSKLHKDMKNKGKIKK